MNSTRNILLFAVLATLAASSAHAINIVVDYGFDTNNFFDTQEKKDAMQAVADRYSAVITSSLLAVGPGGTATGTRPSWRIGFTHPGTGAAYQLSTAADSTSDPLGGTANEYGFAGLAADQWIVFAGGRSLPGAAVGGTDTGLNYTNTYTDLDGPLHRGLVSETLSDSGRDLPSWGGSLAFDTGTSWHFDLNSTAGASDLDFYSIALRELGRALGLASTWNQWADNGAGLYIGTEAIAAYNADNGTSLPTLSLAGAINENWMEGAYDSFVFRDGNPNTMGTVPNDTMQDLLMEPLSNFGGSQNRLELTNVDVAALEDIGWSVIPEPSRALLGPLALALAAFRRRR